MNKPFWEDSTCFLCDYWWIILVIIVLLVVAYFTKDQWMPALGLVRLSIPYHLMC